MLDSERIESLHPDDNEKWRTVIIGISTIQRLFNGDVELNAFHINLLPDDVLFNNREDVAILFGEDVDVMRRIFAARKLLGGKMDERSIVVERRPASGKVGGDAK